MRNKTKIVFFALMFLLSALTVIKYRDINYIKNNSAEFSLIVDGDEEKINDLKANIQSMTYQPVEYEELDGGKYRIVFQYPPDRINSLLSRLQRVGEEKNVE